MYLSYNAAFAVLFVIKLLRWVRCALCHFALYEVVVSGFVICCVSGMGGRAAQVGPQAVRRSLRAPSPLHQNLAARHRALQQVSSIYQFNLMHCPARYYRHGIYSL